MSATYTAPTPSAARTHRAPLTQRPETHLEETAHAHTRPTSHPTKRAQSPAPSLAARLVQYAPVSGGVYDASARRSGDKHNRLQMTPTPPPPPPPSHPDTFNSPGYAEAALQPPPAAPAPRRSRSHRPADADAPSGVLRGTRPARSYSRDNAEAVLAPHAAVLPAHTGNREMGISPDELRQLHATRPRSAGPTTRELRAIRSATTSHPVCAAEMPFEVFVGDADERYEDTADDDLSLRYVTQGKVALTKRPQRPRQPGENEVNVLHRLRLRQRTDSTPDPKPWTVLSPVTHDVPGLPCELGDGDGDTHPHALNIPDHPDSPVTPPTPPTPPPQFHSSYVAEGVPSSQTAWTTRQVPSSDLGKPRRAIPSLQADAHRPDTERGSVLAQASEPRRAPSPSAARPATARSASPASYLSPKRSASPLSGLLGKSLALGGTPPSTTISSSSTGTSGKPNNGASASSGPSGPANSVKGFPHTGHRQMPDRPRETQQPQQDFTHQDARLKRGPRSSRHKVPAQIHVEAMNLPISHSRQIHARITLHGDTLAVTETRNSQNPMFATPFFITPPHSKNIDHVEKVWRKEQQRRKDAGHADVDHDSDVALAHDRIAHMYVIHLHAARFGDIPFASVAVPLKELREAPGQRLLHPLFEASEIESADENSGSSVSSSESDDTDAPHDDTNEGPQTLDGGEPAQQDKLRRKREKEMSRPKRKPSSRRAYLAITYEPHNSTLEEASPGPPGLTSLGLRPAARVQTPPVALDTRSIEFSFRVSAMRRRNRGMMPGQRVQLLVAFYRQTKPHGSARPRWVLIALAPLAGKPAHGQRYVELAKEREDVSYLSACNGDTSRPMRLALYRVDAGEMERFRVIGFHQTSVAELEQASVCGGTPIALQGRYYDETVGSVRITAVSASRDVPTPSASDSGPSAGVVGRKVGAALVVNVQVDLANTKTMVSSTARPGTTSTRASGTGVAPGASSSVEPQPDARVADAAGNPTPPSAAASRSGRVPMPAERVIGDGQRLNDVQLSLDDDDDIGVTNEADKSDPDSGLHTGTKDGTAATAQRFPETSRGVAHEYSSSGLVSIENGPRRKWGDRQRTARNIDYA